MSEQTAKEKIRTYALGLGFDLVGFTKAEPLIFEKEFFEKWLANKFNGDMKYMENNKEKRFDPSQIVPHAQTVIALATNYYNPSAAPREDHKEGNKVAIYAYGRDYHKVLSSRLKKLTTFIATLFPDAQARSYTDTGPFAERSYAAKAGLGFIGKNGCLITREFGSWVFLSHLITNIALEPDPPSGWKGSCGTCTRCIDACPTKAIIVPRTVDATKCISYLTIENRGPIPNALKEKMSGYVFGCDICQLVCPHNSRQKPTREKDFQEPIAGAVLDSAEISTLDTDEKFTQRFAGSPVMRAKRRGLRRMRGLT